MNKIIVNVPPRIRYISEWENFRLPDHPAIINKTLTGCGFTEWCISNQDEHVILCSPRRILLENKSDQHPEAYYMRNDLEKVLDVDKEIIIEENKGIERRPGEMFEIEQLPPDYDQKIKELALGVQNYCNQCNSIGRKCKILVTYDSFKHVISALGKNTIKEHFRVIIDEFQSIFMDSRFKSTTELEFVSQIQGLHKVDLVSATPYVEKYLDMLDDFKNLPYYEFDWAALDPCRVVKPYIEVRSIPKNKSVVTVASEIIQKYLDGKYEKSIRKDYQGIMTEVESKEVVIYVNSVKSICDIIRKCELTTDNTNILCANTEQNFKKVRRAINSVRKTKDLIIGRVPLKGEPNKTITLATRTVYIGADFHSTNARTVILSDSNIECLAVDISMDLPQIMGRQRCDENPWKYRAELYFKSTLMNKIAEPGVFEDHIAKKDERTANLYRTYEKITTDKKAAEEYMGIINFVSTRTNFAYNYLAINHHNGKDKYPIVNVLVRVAEMRAFEIQQIEYRDRFVVFGSLDNTYNTDLSTPITNVLDRVNYDNTDFRSKLKYLCEETNLPDEDMNKVLDYLPITFKNIFSVFSKEEMRARSYQYSKIMEEYETRMNLQINRDPLKEDILATFQVGKRYSRKDIKEKLKELYTKHNQTKVPKATDIQDYFIVKDCRIDTDYHAKEIIKAI